MSISSQYIDLSQAAGMLSMPKETLRYWVHIGRLRAYKPGRRLLFKEADIVALVEASEVGPVAAAAKAKRARGDK